MPSPQPPKCSGQFGSRDPVRWEPPRLGSLLQEHCVAPAWGFPTSWGRQAWHGTALRVAELLAPPPERDCQPQSLHLGKQGSEEEVASSTTFSLQIQTSPRGKGEPRRKAGTGHPLPCTTPQEIRFQQSHWCVWLCQVFIATPALFITSRGIFRCSPRTLVAVRELNGWGVWA